jgi:hypothetical protein
LALLVAALISPAAANAASETNWAAKRVNPSNVVVNPAGFDQADTVSCDADVVVIGARGSGEPNKANARQAPDKPDNPTAMPYLDGAGKPVALATEALRLKLPSTTKLRYINVPYDAVMAQLGVITAPALGESLEMASAAKWINLPQYKNSVRGGSVWAGQIINKVVERCGGTTKIVLLGYSQGAQVIHDVVANPAFQHNSAVSAAWLIADPKRNGADLSTVGYDGHTVTASPGQILSRSAGGLATGPDFPATMKGKIMSACVPTDIVCDTPALASIAKACPPTIAVTARGACLKNAAGQRFNLGLKIHSGSYHSPVNHTAPASWIVSKLPTKITAPLPVAPSPAPKPAPSPASVMLPFKLTYNCNYKGTGTPGAGDLGRGYTYINVKSPEIPMVAGATNYQAKITAPNGRSTNLTWSAQGWGGSQGGTVYWPKSDAPYGAFSIEASAKDASGKVLQTKSGKFTCS